MIGSDRRETHIAGSSAPRIRKISPWLVTGAVALTFVTLPALESVAFGQGPLAAASARPFALIVNRRVLSYPIDQVWPTALRYLRVDRGFAVNDHDREAGYVLFDFPVSGEGKGSGSLEIYETTDPSGRPSVGIAVNTGAGPVHLPNAILDGIAAKLRAERGQPAPPPPSSPPPQKDQPDDIDDHGVPLMPPASDP